MTVQSPNILFIVCDDLNAWISPLGHHPNAITPSIQRLAEQSTLFSRAYCAAPYCNASRMAVFTGCLPTTTGIYQNEPFWNAPRRRQTLLECLRLGGYRLFGAGKVFHGAFDYPTAHWSAAWREMENRADTWDGFNPMPPDPLPANRPLNRVFDFSSPQMSSSNWHFDWGVLPDEREPEMPDSITCDAVCSFLADPGPQPFFCAAGLYKPHLPWYVPQRFFDRYPLDQVTLPLVKADDLDDVPSIARQWAHSPPDHAIIVASGQWQHAVQGYLASITFCDAMVGRLLDALDKSAARDNTIVALWGDNGFHLGEKLHWRKFALWEEATRVPLIVAPARQSSSRASVVDAPVGLIDLLPTLLDLCGLAIPPGIDGRSLTSMMHGDAKGVGRTVITTWLEGNHSVRAGPWRYTRYADGGQELYNHITDPYEWTNLIPGRGGL